MKRDFSLGDRVTLSSLGAVRCSRLAGKIGTVVGRGVYPNSVVVILDGAKSRKTIHGAYLEMFLELEGRGDKNAKPALVEARHSSDS
jgi:hypothetical protein